jgi:hypothetical protein
MIYTHVLNRGAAWGRAAWQLIKRIDRNSVATETLDLDTDLKSKL